MNNVVSFKKLDYSKEAEQLTARVVKSAFYPLKIVLTCIIISFILYFLLGYGNISSYTTTDIFKYMQLALFISALWLIIRIRLGLKCPNCSNSFFKFMKRLQVKPRVCPYCSVIFIKKTHPIEDEYDYSNEFYLLKVEIERRVDLAIFYLTVGMLLFFYLIAPLFTSILGSSFTIFIIFPVVLILSIIHITKQLETRCPSCSEYIKWTELKPTEVSKHCPHCNAKLVK